MTIVYILTRLHGHTVAHRRAERENIFSFPREMYVRYAKLEHVRREITMNTFQRVSSHLSLFTSPKFDVRSRYDDFREIERNREMIGDARERIISSCVHKDLSFFAYCTGWEGLHLVIRIF